MMCWMVTVERKESTYRKAPINPAYGVKVTKADDDHVVQLPEDECTVGGFQKPKRACQFSLSSVVRRDGCRKGRAGN